MNFSELLNHYLQHLSCSAKELSEFSGVSQSTISRYRRGEIEPSTDSASLSAIIDALGVIAKDRDIPLDTNDLRSKALECLVSDDEQYAGFLSRLKTVLSKLNIRNAEFSRGVSYDPSFISRILSGTNRPADREKFTSRTASFISWHIKTNDIPLSSLSKLYGCTEDELSEPNGVFEMTVRYLGYDAPKKAVSTPVTSFLEKMDSFNLDDFIRSIRFNDIKLPTAPFQLPTTKTYLGIKEMKESELDFIKTTVLSRSNDDCILYSDMPLGEMAKDEEFVKKWMFGRAMMLKKGLRLNIIHDVNRPFPEMMLGLEGHIPMYMTGLISPYYLPSSQNSVFCHLINVSGAAALEGSAISGNQGSGRYVLYKSKDDVRHFRTRAEQLLQKAKPLMDIYTADRKDEYIDAMQGLREGGDRYITHCSLPLYTVSEKLLDSILDRCGISSDDRERIISYRSTLISVFTKLTEDHRVVLTVPKLSREQFESSPLNLALADIFFESDITYTFDEYEAHLGETRGFAGSHTNVVLNEEPSPTFKNITYSVIGDKAVVVSKNKYPTIHFIIRHPRMVSSFKSFIPPIKQW